MDEYDGPVAPSLTLMFVDPVDALKLRLTLEEENKILPRGPLSLSVHTLVRGAIAAEV
jgi:hypothetical protein